MENKNEDSMGEFTPKHHQDQLEKIGYGSLPTETEDLRVQLLYVLGDDTATDDPKMDRLYTFISQVSKSSYERGRSESNITWVKENRDRWHEEGKREAIQLARGMMKKYHNKQFHKTCSDCIDVDTYNEALQDLITQLETSDNQK